MRTRTRALLASLLAVSLAACAGGPSQAPAGGAGTAEPATTSSPAVPSPSTEVVVLGVTVHWDGARCVFEGPTVITDGTTLRVDYTFDEGTDPPLLVIVGVTPGTTWDMILERARTHPASDAPDWAIIEGFANIAGGTSALYTVASELAGKPVGGHFVGCATAPAEDGGTDVLYPAALLLVAGP
jgi:hypothetical protein